jgi:CheY-like chemotaxis protein
VNLALQGDEDMTDQHHPVLVVEDEPDIREVMVAILESEGYVTRAATHGAEALAHLRSGLTPCLILLDLMMPVMDGWTFCQERDKDPSLAAIPVIIVSAVARKDPKNSSLRAVDHLPKPLDVGSLLSVVQRYC